MDTTPQTTTRLSKSWRVIALVAAFWPVWLWLCSRALDKSDEPWGICALLTAFYFILEPAFLNARSVGTADFSSSTAGRFNANVSAEPSPATSRCANYQQLAGLVILTIYICTFASAPNLMQALMAICTFWCFESCKISAACKPGLFGLSLLALPVMPSLNFYAGYPLRILTTTGTCFLLNGLGFSTSRLSTLVVMNNNLVSVDGPCSGVNMLWSEGYIVMLAACLLKLRLVNTIILSITGLAIVLFGNTIRATALAIVSQGKFLPGLALPPQLQEMSHGGIGMMSFALVAASTTAVALMLSRRQISAAATPKQESGEKAGAPHNLSCRSLSALTLCLCLVASALPLLPRFKSQEIAPINAHRVIDEKLWPAFIAGSKLQPVRSSAEESGFAAGFPGEMRKFTDGTSSYVVRMVLRETRQLHSSRDCFRGLGYKTEPGPLRVLSDGTRWSSFEATAPQHQPADKLQVLERIYDQRGNSWTDVSEWYWSVCLGQSSGPWCAVTIARPMPPDKFGDLPNQSAQPPSAKK